MDSDLKESRTVWPLVLIPFAIDNAHTRTFTGRCWVKDIKASFNFANLELTDTNLICRYRLFRMLIFDLSLNHLDEVINLGDKPGLILIKFRIAEFGNFTKFALSGQPSGSKNRLIINVTEKQKWLSRLKMLTA